MVVDSDSNSVRDPCTPKRNTVQKLMVWHRAQRHRRWSSQGGHMMFVFLYPFRSVFYQTRVSIPDI